MKVIAGVYSGVTTVELDTLAAETAASLTTKHPDYAILAARIAVSNLHKETKKLFSCELHECAVSSSAWLNCVFFLSPSDSCNGGLVQIHPPYHQGTLPHDLQGNP